MAELNDPHCVIMRAPEEIEVKIYRSWGIQRISLTPAEPKCTFELLDAPKFIDILRTRVCFVCPRERVPSLSLCEERFTFYMKQVRGVTTVNVTALF